MSPTVDMVSRQFKVAPEDKSHPLNVVIKRRYLSKSAQKPMKRLTAGRVDDKTEMSSIDKRMRVLLKGGQSGTTPRGGCYVLGQLSWLKLCP